MTPVAELGKRKRERKPARAKRAPAEPLFSGLQPRWCGLDSEGVAEHQRRRLFEAMISAVAMWGYANTSVSELARLAGVSKRTVYDRFENKEGYFLATYDFVLARATRRIQEAYASESDPDAALCAAFGALVAETVDHPGAAKLALFEALGAGPAALARMDEGRAMFERMLAATVVCGGTLPPMIVKGIAGGVERVARQYVLDGRSGELCGKAEELSGWVSSYEPAAAALVAEQVPRPKQTQPSARWNTWLRGGDDRTRMLRAAAVVAGREGYASLTPERITKLAHVPPDAFSGCFESVRECFLDSLGLLLGVEALACAARASQGHENWMLDIRQGLVELMRYMADHPVLGRVAFVEVFAVGPAAMLRRAEILDRFTELLWSRIPESERPSPLVADLIVGSIWTFTHHCVVRNAKQLLPSMVAQMTFLALAPLVGAKEAQRVALAAPVA